MKTMKFTAAGRRTAALAAAGTLTAAIVLTGTLAWTNMTQSVLNENVIEPNPGGRIHDDFDGTNKDVYAENFTDPEDNGVAVFVRVRLDEYMELGAGAGEADGADGKTATSLVSGAEIGDPTTWTTHKPAAADTATEGTTEENTGETETGGTTEGTTGDAGTEETGGETTGDVAETAATDPFHDYWTWELGGSTVYMPTFNMNKDSLSVDVNGTYDGTDATDNVHYDDYTAWTVGATKTDYEYYDADTNADDEYTGAEGEVPGGGGTEGTNYTKSEEAVIHTAANTQNATVLTMAEWEAMGSPVGRYWVWDADGWAYWAMPLQPGTATGCLLTGIHQKQYFGENCYYAIEVVGQFATAGDWGTPKDEANSVDATGFYIDGITDDALSLLNQAASVTVGADGNLYLDCGSNTYKKIDVDAGTMGDLICAGADEKIGTDDDRADVIVLETELTLNGTSYGTLFLGPTTTSGSSIKTYLSVGTDGRLGTSDDVKLWYSGTADDFSTDTANISTVGANGVTVTAANSATEVNAGAQLQFYATVQLNETAIDNQTVTWKLSGGKTGTTINASTGLLTVAADEAVNEKLTITAVSAEDTNAKGEYIVTVLGPENITVTAAGSATKVNAGGTLQFTAKVTGSDNTDFSSQAVTWTLAESSNSGTTLSDNGLLTVALGESADSLTVTATSKVDGAKSASAAVSVVKVDTVTVSPDTVEVEKGGNQTFTASVTVGGKDAYSQAVTWTVSGNSSSTTIDETTGALAVASDETASTLKVTATSTYNTSVTGTATVTVPQKAAVAVGDVVTLDSIPFVVLDVDDTNNTALLLSQYILEELGFDEQNHTSVGSGGHSTYGDNAWSVSRLRTYLNSTDASGVTVVKGSNGATTTTSGWLYNKPEIQKAAVATTLYTQSDYNKPTDFIETQDKIFLLSQADVFGSYDNSGTTTNTSEAKYYTLGKKLDVSGITALSGSWIAKHTAADGSAAAWWWLRSPRGNRYLVAYVYTDGTLASTYGCVTTGGVRPAFVANIQNLPSP